MSGIDYGKISLEKFEAGVLANIKKAQRTMKTPNGDKIEGMPIGWLPLAVKPLLDRLLATGRFELVSRPARVNEKRLATFVREVK